MPFMARLHDARLIRVAGVLKILYCVRRFDENDRCKQAMIRMGASTEVGRSGI
jgi:hypothetical protein